MNDLAAAVAAALGRAFGAPVGVGVRRPLGGGSINRTELVETTAGTFVLKSNRHAPAGMFRAEAAGLSALRASGTSLVVPRVVAVHDSAPAFLLLEYLAAGPRTSDFDEALGRGLAGLHQSTSARFGFDHDNFCGATMQPNPWTDGWVDFYAASRLGHQAELAGAAGRLGADERRAIAGLIDRLGRWIDEPVTGPSLVHGDLWSGNLLRDAGGRPALVDPAAYFAHREAELGMMTLFGGFSERVFAAYHEAFPLDPDWRDRQALYQLYHLLNHLNLFGGGYRAAAMAIVRRYV